MEDLRKLWNMRMTVIPVVIAVFSTVTKGLVQRLEGLGNRTSGDRPNYSIIKTGQTSKKSAGNLRKFAVAQTPVKSHHLTLVRKTC